MKNFVRLAVAAVVAAGASAGTFAQSLPISGSADLWLFVSDPGVSKTFAVDTGISLNSLAPSSYTTGAKAGTNSYDVDISFTSSALASFVASSGNQAGLQWAVEGVQYPSVNTSLTPGTVIGVQSNNAVLTKTTGMIDSNLRTWGQGFNGDIGYLLQTYQAGGTVYNWSAGDNTVNAWGAHTGNSGGSTNTYGQGPDQTFQNPGIGSGTENLYFYTANGNPATLQTYSLGELALNADGTLATVGGDAPPAVPVPAAVWLFGSGLLGLMGVGRRRAA